MIDPDLDRLHRLADMLYQRDMRELARVRDREARIHARRAQLEQQARQAVEGEDLDALRRLGGDMLWQDWALRRRAELNVELARARLLREQAIAGLRRSFGKRQALESLRRQAGQRALQTRRAVAEARLAATLSGPGRAPGSDLLTGDLGDKDIGDRVR
ncbi:MAG: hypothetical protein ACLFRU_02035 [Paracoccaceae bacterium]